MGGGGGGGPHVSPLVAALAILVILVIVGAAYFMLGRSSGPVMDTPSSQSGDDYGKTPTESTEESPAAREEAKSFQESDSPGGQ